MTHVSQQKASYKRSALLGIENIKKKLQTICTSRLYRCERLKIDCSCCHISFTLFYPSIHILWYLNLCKKITAIQLRLGVVGVVLLNIVHKTVSNLEFLTVELEYNICCRITVQRQVVSIFRRMGAYIDNVTRWGRRCVSENSPDKFEGKTTTKMDVTQLWLFVTNEITAGVWWLSWLIVTNMTSNHFHNTTFGIFEFLSRFLCITEFFRWFNNYLQI